MTKDEAWLSVFGPAVVRLSTVAAERGFADREDPIPLAVKRAIKLSDAIVAELAKHKELSP